MLKLKRRTGNRKGFTLVEVVVVAVIVAVLAAVGIGVYIQYVDSARAGAVRNLAASLADFCGACRNGGGEVEQDGTSLTCDGGEGDGSSINYDASKHTIAGTLTGGSGGTITVTDATDGDVSAEVQW